VKRPGLKSTRLKHALWAAVLAGALAAPAVASAEGIVSKVKSAARLALKSSSVLVLDQFSGEVLYGKNPNAVVPIASITKLMTAMVVLDAQSDPDEPITVTEDDVDWLRGSSSRLAVGAVLTRDQMLRLALMASENRAASALSRAYPGGRAAFVAAMNEKARSLGLQGTRYSDPTGLSSTNVSTAEDLATLVATAHTYPLIREYSTARGLDLQVGRRTVAFHNTNRLVANSGWDIGLSKTGFINEAGRCLVMQAKLAGRGVIIVLLDSWGKNSRLADAARIRQWIEVASSPEVQPAHKRAGQKSRRVISASKAGRSA
jgi:D-alanyl-D-alanine endopeptidase (penicillin-binding protein 7)